MTQYGMRD